MLHQEFILVLHEVQKRAQPYPAKPFPIPKVHKENLKTEVNRLVNIGVLKDNKSKWAAPTFIIPINNGLILENLIKDLKGNHFLFLKYRIYF